MYNEKIKNSIMKWRENNKQEYNEYMREHIYKKHSEKIKTRRMGKYYLEKEMKIFRKILL